MHQSQYDDCAPSLLRIRRVLPDVVAQACQKDHQAFKTIYEYYQQPLGRRLMSLVHNNEVMLDLYQDTFVRAWETISQKVAEYFERWLYRIAVNLAIDYLRRKKLIDFVSISESNEYDRFAELSVEGEEDRICELLCLQEAIALMSPQYRTCLLLQVYWGFTQREIASSVGISESAVSANVSRAYKQLSQHYSILDSAFKSIEDAVDKRPPLADSFVLESGEDYQEWQLRKERIRKLLLPTYFPYGLSPRLQQLWQDEDPSYKYKDFEQLIRELME